MAPIIEDRAILFNLPKKPLQSLQWSTVLAKSAIKDSDAMEVDDNQQKQAYQQLFESEGEERTAESGDESGDESEEDSDAM